MSATSERDVTRDSRVTISVSHARSHAPVTESRPVPSRPVPKSVVGLVFECGSNRIRSNGYLGAASFGFGDEIR